MKNFFQFEPFFSAGYVIPVRAKYVTSMSQVIFSPRTGIVNIEDVERGAELSFSGPLRGPCIIVKFCFQTIKFWLVSPNFFGFRQDRQTDRQTQ